MYEKLIMNKEFIQDLENVLNKHAKFRIDLTIQKSFSDDYEFRLYNNELVKVIGEKYDNDFTDICKLQLDISEKSNISKDDLGRLD